MRKTLTLATFLLVICALAFGADISGKWTSNFDSQIGPQSYTYVFKVDGNKLTGTATSEAMGETQIVDGKVMGDEISFAENRDAQGMPLHIEYHGKVTGDEFKLTRKVGEFATYDITVKRAK